VGWVVKWLFVVTELDGWMDGMGRLRSQESVPCRTLRLLRLLPFLGIIFLLLLV